MDFDSFAIRNVIEGRIFKLFNCRFLWKSEPYITGSEQIIFYSIILIWEGVLVALESEIQFLKFLNEHYYFEKMPNVCIM